MDRLRKVNADGLAAAGRDGLTALMVTARRNDAECLRILLAPPMTRGRAHTLDAQPVERWAYRAPLRGARRRGDAATVLLYYDNVNARSVTKYTPLMWAAKHNQWYVAAVMCEYAPDDIDLDTHSNINLTEFQRYEVGDALGESAESLADRSARRCRTSCNGIACASAREGAQDGGHQHLYDEAPEPVDWGVVLLEYDAGAESHDGPTAFNLPADDPIFEAPECEDLVGSATARIWRRLVNACASDDEDDGDAPADEERNNDGESSSSDGGGDSDSDADGGGAPGAGAAVRRREAPQGVVAEGSSYAFSGSLKPSQTTSKHSMLRTSGC